MDLGSSVLVERPHGRSVGERLADIARGVQARRRLEVVELAEIWEWADFHTITADQRGAATITEGHLDTGVPIAGPGAPLVSEFALMELIAVLQRTPDGGRDYVGKVLELGWRLPRTRAAVLQGRCPVFKALRVAELTRALSEEAAWWVDRNIGFCVGTATWAQVERLVAEAVTRFDPDRAEERRRAAGDGRRFDVDLDQVRDGVVSVEGVLDAADAADLDRAVARRATVLARLGCGEPLEVRRAIVVGDLARNDLALDLDTVDPETGEITTVAAGRRVELHVHLAQAAVTGGALHPDGVVARWEDQRTPVTAAQVREWCGLPGTSIIVRPVIDVAAHVPVDSYEIPDRLRRQVRLRDHHCAFPDCGRPAVGCDLDHARPYAAGGVTCACNLVPACRRHHRAKTHSQWRYAVIETGRYLWISPNGRHWLVDHTGTRALDPPRRLDPEVMDVIHDWETSHPHPDLVPACPATTQQPPTPPTPRRVAEQLDIPTDPPPE